MEKIFKYGRMDKQARITTILSIATLLGISVLVWFFGGEGGYTMAWFISLIAAVLILVVLSVPRSIRITEEAVDIRCVMEMTHVPLSELQSIRLVERNELKRTICLLGSWGFFGYFGVYLDLKRMKFVRLYCMRWSNFVEIIDIHGKRIYISSSRPKRFVDRVTKALDQYDANR